MSKECWVGTAKPVKPNFRALGLVTHPLELATRPPDDISIDPFQGWTQLRLVEVAVVDDPAAYARVVHLVQFGQRFVVAMMKRPAADITADARQRLRAGGGLETVREDAPVRLHPHDLSGSKLEAQKVEVDIGEAAAPVHILAVDDLRLLRMQHQLADREAVGNRTPECPRLLGALAVTNDIVRVSLERDMRKGFHHPHVERVMQEQIRQGGADDTSLRSSGHSRHDATILHLHRSLKPALDVEQHPRTIRMITDGPEHQLPVDTVEKSLDVEIEHPVVAPAALASLVHGIDRRFAGPVAIRVNVEHWLQDRLQIASGNLLGDAVGDRWNPQRPHPTVHLRNIDPQHRRRKVAS